MWHDERCTPTAEAKAADLYADFRAWKTARGENAPSATTWFQRLETLPGVTKRRSNGWRYQPISLKPITWGMPRTELEHLEHVTHIGGMPA